jgi:anti-sigma28 factor (negative regulator of flagellin synthesis)
MTEVIKMKIDGILSEVRNIVQADRKAAESKDRAGSARPRNDVVQISDRARTLKSQQENAAAALKETPDVRQARVLEVKERMASGYYDRPEVRQAVADSILNSGVMKPVVTEKRQVDTAKAALAKTPDVRQDRVDQAKQRAASGYYETPEVRRKAVDGLIEGVLG